MIRTKFKCESVLKTENNKEFLYETRFVVVTNNSKENSEFFKWTPFGELKIGVHKKDEFVPGREYYIDIWNVEDQIL